jgi:hypothetical protein
MSEHKTQQTNFEAWMADVLKQAHDIGFAAGFEKGTVYGFARAMEATKSAVSDGLRKGSSECGKDMRSRRKD